jgi:hypothetical protein
MYKFTCKMLSCLALFTLTVDWQALGLDPANVRVSLPDIGALQKAQATIDLSQPLAIEPGQDIVIGVEKGRP